MLVSPSPLNKEDREEGQWRVRLIGTRRNEYQLVQVTKDRVITNCDCEEYLEYEGPCGHMHLLRDVL